MTQSIALFGATYFELNPILKRIQVQKKWRQKHAHIYQATWKGLSLYIVRSGVGAKRAEKAAEALLKKVTPDFVFSMGLCGGMDPSLKVGETILGNQLLEVSTKKKFALNTSFRKEGVQGMVVSVDKIFGPLEKQAIRKKYAKAMVCDMESGALASIFSPKKIPLSVFRTVSDPFDWEFLPEEILLERDWKRQLKLLLAYSKWRFPVELFRLLLLGWRAKRAVSLNTKNILNNLLFFVDKRLQ